MCPSCQHHICTLLRLQQNQLLSRRLEHGRRLQHITWIIFLTASPEKHNTGKWTMDAANLKFMEAEISKTLLQKDHGTVNCWLLNSKKVLTKVSLLGPFRRNPRDMSGTQKPSKHPLSFTLQRLMLTRPFQHTHLGVCNRWVQLHEH